MHGLVVKRNGGFQIIRNLLDAGAPDCCGGSTRDPPSFRLGFCFDSPGAAG